MKLFASLIIFLCLTTSAWAEMPRGCVGPTRAIANATYYPTNDGFDTRAIDGDMTSAVWWKGTGDITVEVQATLFTKAEDPSNLSWYTVASRGALNKLDSVIGPVQRIRWFVSSCTGDCTTDLKACGRVAP